MTVKRIVPNIAAELVDAGGRVLWGHTGHERSWISGGSQRLLQKGVSRRSLAWTRKAGPERAAPDLSIEVDNLEEIYPARPLCWIANPIWPG